MNWEWRKTEKTVTRARTRKSPKLFTTKSSSERFRPHTTLWEERQKPFFDTLFSNFSFSSTCFLLGGGPLKEADLAVRKLQPRENTSENCSSRCFAENAHCAVPEVLTHFAPFQGLVHHNLHMACSILCPEKERLEDELTFLSSFCNFTAKARTSRVPKAGTGSATSLTGQRPRHKSQANDNGNWNAQMTFVSHKQ